MTDAQTSRPMVELTLDSPIFGPCRLVEHSGGELPVSLPVLGYVELEGQPDSYQQAMNLKGEWCTRNSKPFPRPIVRWFHLERIKDGTPILGH